MGALSPSLLLFMFIDVDSCLKKFSSGDKSNLKVGFMGLVGEEDSTQSFT